MHSILERCKKLTLYLLAKFWHRQNFRVNKILASTKNSSTKSRRQNVAACAEASPYCFGPAKSAAADYSRTSLMFSYFSLKMLYSPCSVTKCAVATGRPAFMGGLSPALCRLIRTSPLCRKRHQYWCRQNIGARQDFTSFCQTIAVAISAHRHPIKNW